MSNKTTVYDDGFFSAITSGSERSASVVVPLIVEMFRPTSILDVGCGVGAWTKTFQDAGVTSVIGVDGAYVNRSMLRIRPELFQEKDLESQLTFNRTFDLVICFEVAEHLSSGRAASLVEDLTTCAPIVVFSAAIPGQGGTHHINEQWQSYWVDLFQSKKYIKLDSIRARIWDNDSVHWWYRQNILCYVQDSIAEKYAHWDQPIPVNVVHPSLFRERIRELQRPTILNLIRGLKPAVQRSIRFRLGDRDD